MDKIHEEGYRETDTHIYFWGSFLSNFEICDFKYGYCFRGEVHIGKCFCSEQAFMWAKALYFGDDDTAEEILNMTNDPERDPYKCKKLGRKVKNYDDDEWNKIRYEVMVDVNRAKYSQNPQLKNKLILLSLNHKFVEASPYDKIWGVGIGMIDDAILDEKKWKGQNLLGKALDQVANELKLAGMLTVGDLIEHLKKYDPKSYILYGEMNAFNGGFWQHLSKDMVQQFAHSVKEDKADVEERFKNNEAEKNHILNRDYIFANDNDVVVRF